MFFCGAEYGIAGFRTFADRNRASDRLVVDEKSVRRNKPVVIPHAYHGFLPAVIIACKPQCVAAGAVGPGTRQARV